MIWTWVRFYHFSLPSMLMETIPCPMHIFNPRNEAFGFRYVDKIIPSTKDICECFAGMAMEPDWIIRFTNQRGTA